MHYVENAQELTGYKVRHMRREAFNIVGYTAFIGGGYSPSQFYDEVIADGRLKALMRLAPIQSWILGLGSWDPECQGKGDYRYTICIEETAGLDASPLEKQFPQLFRKQIGASEWLCFEKWKLGEKVYDLLPKLGYRLHTRKDDYSVGLHFDACPAGVAVPEDHLEFWITVTSL